MKRTSRREVEDCDILSSIGDNTGVTEAGFSWSKQLPEARDMGFRTTQ
jgi:hypothetical protein